MTIPGRAVRIVMRQRLAARSIRILGTDADSSFFFSRSRISRSSVSSRPNSFLPAYHFERQSRFTAMRRPTGLVFCPILITGAMECWSAGGSYHSSERTILMWQLRLRIGPAEPRALGVNRRIVEAVWARASLTTSVSVFSALYALLLAFRSSALAIADLSVLATKRAPLRGVTARVA